MMRYIILFFALFLIQYGVLGQTYSLDSCQVLAIDNNKSLKEVRMNIQAAELVKKNAFTNYFPKVNAGISIIKSSDNLLELDIPEMQLPVYDGNPANLANATQFAFIPGMKMGLMDYLNYGYVSAVQPIYAGGQIRNGNKMANLGIEINKQNLALSEDKVKVKTEEFFWTSMLLKEKMKTLLRYEELIDTLLKDVEITHEAGLIQKSDLLKVQLKKNELQTNKLQLKNGIDIVSMALCQHIGIPYSKNVNFENELVVNDSPLQYLAGSKKSILNRMEFQILSNAKKAEELKHKMILGEYMPQFAVGISGLHLDVLENVNTNLLAFATINIPISDWWGGSSKMKEQKVHIKIAQNKIDETEELLELEMEQNYKNLNEAYERIFVAQKSITQAEEHHRVIRDNYSAGLVNTSDLLEAQAMLQQTKDAETEALVNYKIRLAHYLKSIGK